MNAQDTKTLGQRIERELVGQAITEHDVAALVQQMAKANAGPLWSAAHNASDTGFRVAGRPPGDEELAEALRAAGAKEGDEVAMGDEVVELS